MLPTTRKSLNTTNQGNIEKLWRDQDYTGVDFLQMTYNGNQIKSITDAYTSQGQYSVKEYQNMANLPVEFAYDKNGNMTKDLDRDIVTIKYNLLNLPDTIQFKSGHQIFNTYDAGGRKLRADYITKHTPILLPIDKDTVCHWDYASGLISMSTTLYVDNKEYEIVRSPVQYNRLNRIHNPEGYVSNFEAYPPAEQYCYYRKDHLGNNREVWRAGYTSGITGNQIAATTIQHTQYYPSGLPWASNTSDNPGSQPYKYNGKEFVEMHGWDMYDYGARGMSPAIMRFATPDPLAENKPWLTPYHYCSNNSINRVDVDGRWDVKVHVANGYGTAIVTDRHGNEVYKFQIRAEGVGGHNRMKQNSDTPYGTYDIPDNRAWTSGGSRASYGRYARLVMIPESGEIVESGRNLIRIHGGRQEAYDPETGNWIPIGNPELKKTGGCLRAFDKSMKEFKNITDNLQKNDKVEIPGKVVVSEAEESVKTETIKGVEINYRVPESSLVYWQYLINQLLENK
jgi:RHS repeat-associated protein